MTGGATMSDAVVLLGVAAAAGVAGSVHCIAMCGGIASVGTATGATPPPRPLGAALMFHAGRILSYSLIGAGLALGARGASSLFPAALEGTGRFVAAAFMAALAARIFLNRDILGMERLGARGFRHLMPLWRQLLRAPGPLRQPALGSVWGLMPCGLVYSMLAVAVASGRPLLAMMSMAAFGLGTVPALMSFTLGAGRLRSTLRAGAHARLASGALVLACALWTGAGATLHLFHGPMGHASHAVPAAVSNAAAQP
jgi:uncharacterized protein